MLILNKVGLAGPGQVAGSGDGSMAAAGRDGVPPLALALRTVPGQARMPVALSRDHAGSGTGLRVAGQSRPSRRARSTVSARVETASLA
jgi:hypothetical protein